MDLDESDYGEYVCGAENRLGADKGTMKLYRKFKLHEFRRFGHCNSCGTFNLNPIGLSRMLNNNQEALRLTNRSFKNIIENSLQHKLFASLDLSSEFRFQNVGYV